MDTPPRLKLTHSQKLDVVKYRINLRKRIIKFNEDMEIIREVMDDIVIVGSDDD